MSILQNIDNDIKMTSDDIKSMSFTILNKVAEYFCGNEVFCVRHVYEFCLLRLLLNLHQEMFIMEK